MTAPGSLFWFAQHEARLIWRDWLAMMTAGRRRRLRTVAVALVVIAACMHLVAYSMVGPYAQFQFGGDKRALVVVTGILLLLWSLMLSQAMESVTRAFYARADLDLILSSPAAAQKIFAVRIATMALAIALMGMALASPFINVLALGGGARWLASYGVAAALGMAAAACAVALTVALFRTISPKRTRLVAQIVAAVIGAAFVIALQLGAIQSYGRLSRIDMLASDTVVTHAPNPSSPLYAPALAALGDPGALASVLATSLFLLLLSILLLAPRFGEYAAAAAGVLHSAVRERRRSGFRAMTPRRALRQKEWTLLRRDPWLTSQTLMQMLYLLPPAVLLSRSFDDGAGVLLVVVPVLVMAAGQLAGGLAWLAISGEDAPDLVATAPIAAGRIMQAKIEAVMGGIAMVFLPFVAALALISFRHATVAAAGIAAAAVSATQIQLWFRAQAKRSLFRRRQVSSRLATFAEAFSSITWAATAALASAGTMLAGITAAIAAGILLVAWLVSPSNNARAVTRPG